MQDVTTIYPICHETVFPNLLLMRFWLPLAPRLGVSGWSWPQKWKFSNEERAASFPLERLSVSVQWFKSVLWYDTFVVEDVPNQQSFQLCDHMRNVVVCNFGRVCLSVCVSDIGSSFSHIRNTSSEYGSSSYMKVIESRSQEQKVFKILSPQ